MRHELYSDNKDEFKWDTVIKHAVAKDQIIDWVVCLRPKIGKHGNVLVSYPQAKPSISQFFTQERAALPAPPASRNAYRVRNLCQQEGVQLQVHTGLYRTSQGLRDEYFDEVVSYLNARNQGPSTLVLIDVDNGLGVSNNGRQATAGQLDKIYQNLKTGDTLAFVQFRHRGEAWPTDRVDAFAQAIGVPGANVNSPNYGSVAILIVDK